MVLRGFIALLRFLAARRRVGSLTSPDVRSLVIIEMTRLGDVVAMMTAVREFQKHFPSAPLHLIVHRRHATLVEGFFPEAVVHGVRDFRSPGSFLAAIRLCCSLNADLVCSMSPAKRNALLALSSRAPFIAGYLRYTDSLTPFLHNNPVESFGFKVGRNISYGRENIEERGLKVLDALGIERKRDITGLRIDPERLNKATAQLRSNGSIPNTKYVVVHPFAGWKFREWALQNYGILATLVADRLSYDVVFLCGPEDGSRLSVMRERFGNHPHIHFFVSDDGLDSASLIKNSSLFIGNDSGPLHLAALLGVQVVGLFGPAEPMITGPRTTEAVFLHKAIECSPCEQHVCVRPAEPCMSLIGVDEAIAVVSQTLLAREAEQLVANA
jgi:ADP-heptose:LPS heptosyltransferase